LLLANLHRSDVCGFIFRDPPAYSPSPELDAFLKNGLKPIYIGFGSIVVEDPETLTRTILEAVETCGVRAIISKGWSNLECDKANESVFFLGDCPHGVWSGPSGHVIADTR
jgi:UDP:flavonoid glycosyltransferase YjiC (YdhE family)